VGQKWRSGKGFFDKIRSLEVIGKGLRATVRALLACADLEVKGYSHGECLQQGFAPLLHLFRGGE